MNFVASFYPQEHRTPPLPLVALIGCSELHREISDYFIQHHRPPLVFHGSNEPLEQFVARAFGPKKQSPLVGGPLPGILKADWFAKHRGKKPAMVVALVERRELDGDPSTWNRMMYGLKQLADAAGQRGAGVLVGVVQQQGQGDLPPDRVQAVSHNLTLDRRLILPLALLPPPGVAPDDPATRHVRDAALTRLGRLALELAAAYYGRLARAVADKAAARRSALGGPLPPELAARTAFKLAVYAEFRQDWATAVAHYREAYAAILAVQIGLPPRPQRWSEVCAVAELVHLKLLMLAVHQGRLEEAVAQVRAHLGHFARPKGVLPASAQGAHLGFLVRQYQVAAQEVGTHVDALPAYYTTTTTTGAAGTAAIGGGGTTSVGGGPAAAGMTGGSTTGAAGGGLMQQQLTGGGATAGMTGTGAGITGSGATGSSTIVSSASLKDCSRAHLLMAAARLAVARRQQADALRAARAGGGGALGSGSALGSGGGGAAALDTAPVRRGPYVGQLVLRNEAAQGGYSPLSDQDYLLFLESEECRLVTPAAVIDVMSSALLLLKDAPGADRLRSQLGGLMAQEHVLAGSLSSARKLLLQVCHQYRREGWLLPLLQALLSLRDVAQRLRLPAEHLCYSLEICALANQLQYKPAVLVPLYGSGGSGQHPIKFLTAGGSGAAVGDEDGGDAGGNDGNGTVSTAISEQASCCARLVDLGTAMAACRSAVQTLITGISEIKQGIMKTAPTSTDGTPAPGAGAGPGPFSPDASGLAPAPATGASGGLPRHFHYTVEHLDLREAQRRARDAGDPRPVAELMHRHTQHDYGWSRCVSLAAGFAYTRPDPDSADFYLGLFCGLPRGLPLKAVVLHFADDQGDMWVQALPGVVPPHAPPYPLLPGHIGSALDSATHSFHHLHLNTHLRQHPPPPPGADGAQPDAEPEAERTAGHAHAAGGPASTSSTSGGPGEGSATLPPQRWTHYSARLAPRCLGRLRAERAILLLSDHATVVFKLASFPPATAASAQPGVLTGPLLGGGRGGADAAAAPFRSVRSSGPTGGPAVSPGQLVLNVAHLGPLPSLSYGLPSGLALLGEHAPLLAVLEVPREGRPLVNACMEFVIGRTSGGLQPGDIVLVVDDAAGPQPGLMALNNERYRIQLPTVQPGRRYTVRLWARASAAGTAAVGAMLLCPAQVTATATLTFEEPFDFKCRMSSEVGVHTLSLPRLTSRDLGSTALTIGQPVVLTAMLRALQPAVVEVASAQVALEPGSAIRLVADPNQQLAAHGPPPGVGPPTGPGGPSQAPTSLASTLGPDPAAGPAGAAAVASGALVVAPYTRLTKSDVMTLLLPICPTELLDHPRSLGRLNIRWRRPAGHVLLPQQPAPHATASGSGSGSDAAGSSAEDGGFAGAEAGDAEGQREGEGAEGAVGEANQRGDGFVDPLAPPCPDPWVTTTLELPRVTVAESLLTARTVGPSAITTGIPFTYSLQLQNFGTTPLELMITLQDAPGFACANERSPSLSVPPRERAGVSWQLTASQPGHQLLPGVRLLAPRHNCALTTQSPHVYVQPF
ncbi:hypothetical protein HYH03_015627 [Edaphochlamys debaryana]|uniref:Trafficking protein particle complex subunit 11 domain-containing protein n=1 Tax=Edaphochlamys debaryana TaxID=47281 RepID=A0A835XLJ5_9CHLO|nr:hypothetical protein HYH03_015627 [Edaphochlamys debaryana]|eukprot:KAG2485655.1 hypothetical protein HYH03_015627 [Edaphochlamys debaryana]